jgi:preprotein translocase subunit SecD
LGSRSSFRLIVVIVVALAGLQVAFQPVGIEGRLPVLHGPALRMNLGLDLQGGSMLVLEGKDTATVKATPQAVDDAKRVIERRIDQLGVVEPSIQRQGTNRIIVELPGLHDPEKAIALLGKTALLEFVDTGPQALPHGACWTPDGKTVIIPAATAEPGAGCKPQGARTIPLAKKVILTGADLETAQAAFDQSATSAGEPIVQFKFKSKAAKTFEDFTGKNVGGHLTIVLDNEVISSPVIRSQIPGGTGVISGGFRDIEEARNLAVLLRGGALPIPVEVIENRTVGPELGRDAIDASLHASWIAFTMVAVFMVLYYGLPGLLADIALALYLVVVVALLTLLGATLTLPGIAGIVLSVGMAVDANIIIFEKIKEELRAGKTLRSAISTGWNRAMSAIIDSNVTTLIAAAILFFLGTGPIRGFAVTLAIGVFVSMYTAIVVTRLFVDSVAVTSLGPRLIRMAGRTA